MHYPANLPLDMPKKKSIIGIYADTGVAPNSFLQLKKLLSGFYTIVKLKAGDIISQDWPQEMKAIVIPGGADMPYHLKLQGQGCANIRQFVENGGVYIGLCAGSYFAAQEIHFTCKDGTIIHQPRELNFYKGRAVGPAFGIYLEDGQASAQLVPVKIDNNTYHAYFNGGGYFEGYNLVNSKDIKILAYYHKTNQPMALKCKVEKGCVLLCAVHPEYDNEFIESAVARKVKGYEALLPMLDIGISPEVKLWFLRIMSDVIF